MKYIIITGASSGIGRALAVSFQPSDCHILVIGRNEVALQQTKALAGYQNVTTVVADLSEYDQLDKIANILKPGDTIKYLVHCAVNTEPFGSLSAVSHTEIERSVKLNVLSPLYLTKKLSPFFNAKDTRVLFMGSDYVGVDNKIRPHITGAYGMSKSALRVAVEYLRHEYKDIANIGYLNPGSTNTPTFNKLKKAVVDVHGVFGNSGEPIHPNYVAAFIHKVLEETSNIDFTKTNWNFKEQQTLAVNRPAKL